MHSSNILYFLLLQGALASPLEGPQQHPDHLERKDTEHLERRLPGFGDIPFPKMPRRNKNSKKMGNGKDCDSNTQENACSGGNPYCCTSDGKGGQICSNTTACTQTIICCNNNNGFQICIGDMNFNQPITINIYK